MKKEEATTLSKNIEFADETFRDGAQSLWAMKMNYGTYAAVAEDMDKVGFWCIDVPAHSQYFTLAVRIMKEDPWETMRLFKRKLQHTPTTAVMGNVINVLTRDDSREMVHFWNEALVRNTGLSKAWTIVGTGDELTRDVPNIVPHFRKLGLDWSPAIAYTISPRHTDEHFAKLVRDCLPFKPDTIWLKDAGGLLTPERIKTLVPAMMKEAPGVPFEIHSHGTSTFEPAVLAECMKLDVKIFHTCVRPLAFGSSKCAVDTAAKNAEILGYTHNLNLEPLKEIERKLRMIAYEENLPIGAPLEYDAGQYVHMVPGGVISNLVNQLNILGIAHKLKEVLEEVPRIHKDLGYPVMITPFSQFIVSQAAVNVATGERYKEVLDSIVEMVLGVYGVEDTGLALMDQNVKDRLLGIPSAKRLAKIEAERLENFHAGTVKDVRTMFGMMDASDEDFLLTYVMGGDAEIKKMREAGAPKSYYTGKEPLALLLNQLSKDHDISRLEIRK
jgi:oxaloacetate decarboxylase alpha subunit